MSHVLQCTEIPVSRPGFQMPFLVAGTAFTKAYTSRTVNIVVLEKKNLSA